MSDRLDRIRATLQEALQPESMDIVDESHLHAGHPGASSGGGHYDLTIVAECFHGQNTVARHRMIYAALSREMGTDIHALSIKAFAPEEI